jgi:hypothetical protein
MTDAKMKLRVRGWIHRCESGMGVTFTAIWYIFLLFMLLAMVFDFGRVAYISSVSYNAARVAAQEAAKNVDKDAFAAGQDIVFTNNSMVVADATYRLLTDGVIPPYVAGSFRAERRKLPNGQKFFRIEVQTSARLAMLESMFGIPPVLLTVEAFAEPAYGIDEEQQ